MIKQMTYSGCIMRKKEIIQRTRGGRGERQHIKKLVQFFEQEWLMQIMTSRYMQLLFPQGVILTITVKFLISNREYIIS